MNAGVIFINIYILFSAMHQNVRARSSLNLKTMCEVHSNIHWHSGRLQLQLLYFCQLVRARLVLFMVGHKGMTCQSRDAR